MRLRSLTLLAGFFLSTLPMLADTTYTYTGNPFTSASLPYTTSDFISGSVTVSAPLGDNLTLGSAGASSFSFSDGVETFNDGNTPENTFLFSTDASGNITGWIVAFIGSSGDQLASLNFDGAGDSVLNGQEGASNIDNAGTWSSVTVTPEPSSLALLGTGVLGLLGATRRRFVRG